MRHTIALPISRLLPLLFLLLTLLSTPGITHAQSPPVEHSYGALDLPNLWTATNGFINGIYYGPYTIAQINAITFPPAGMQVLCTNCSVPSDPCTIGSNQIIATFLNGAWDCSTTSGGSGTVNNFIAGNLPPIFTTTVLNPTTAPQLSFTLTAASANLVFGTCGSTTPSYCALTVAMEPATTVNTNQSNVYSTGFQNFASVTEFQPKEGTTASIPASCTTGDIYLATDATPGQNWYFCTSTNVWTQQLNSGAGGLTGSGSAGVIAGWSAASSLTTTPGTFTPTSVQFSMTGSGITTALNLNGTNAISTPTWQLTDTYGQTIESIPPGAGTYPHEQGININIPTGSTGAGVLNINGSGATPAAIFTAAGTLTLASSLTLKGSSSGQAVLSATATAGTLNLGSTNATVTGAGALTVVSCAGCGPTTAAAVVALFSGCSGVLYLGADAACHIPGSGTVNSGTIHQLAQYAATGTVVSGTSAIPNGITASTQSPGDASLLVTTDAFVSAAITVAVPTCGVAGTIAWYPAGSVSAISCDTNFTDVGGLLNYVGALGFSAPVISTTGSHAGQIALGAGTALGAVAGSFALMAPTTITSGYVWTVPSADCNGLITVASDVITCTASSGIANVVYNNAVNTFTTAGTLDISASTVANALKIPSAAGLTSNGTSSMAYETAAGNLHGPIAGADAILYGAASALTVNRVPKAGSNTQGLLVNSALTDSSSKLTYNGANGIESDNNPIPAYAIDTGAAQAIAITVNGFPAAIQPGLCVMFKTANASGGATTLNVTPAGGSAYGAIALVKKTTGGVAALGTAGDVTNGGIYTACYDSTEWVLGATSSTIYTGGALTTNGIMTGNSNNQAQGASNITLDATHSFLAKENGETLAAFGNRYIRGATSQKAETTTADANVLTVTPVAVAGTYEACVVISLSAATSSVVSWTLSWTDSNGSAQSNIAQNLTQTQPAGTAASAQSFTTSTAPSNFSGCTQFDVNNAAGNIVIKWVGGGTTTAKMSAVIERIQ